MVKASIVILILTLALQGCVFDIAGFVIRGGRAPLGKLEYLNKYTDSVKALAKPLRTDGYYYAIGSRYTLDTKHDYMILVLYYDGTVFVESWYDPDGEYVADFSESNVEYLIQKNRNFRATWGAYIIEKDSIKFQYYTPSDNIFCDFLRTYKGTIINDSTIHFKYYHDTKCGGSYPKKGQIDFEFKFFPMENKPDSSNTFLFK